MKFVSFDDFFAVLGNPQRVRILQLLNKTGEQNVNSIADQLSLEQSAVSHNMTRLLECHFVTVHPNGKERIYSINQDTVAPIFDQIEQHVKKHCAKGCEHWEK